MLPYSACDAASHQGLGIEGDMSMDHPVSALWSGMDQQLYGLNCGGIALSSPNCRCSTEISSSVIPLFRFFFNVR